MILGEIIKKGVKMSKTTKFFMIMGLVYFLQGILYASPEWEYEYHVPHVLSGFEYYPANDAYTHLWVIITEDGTNYEIDQDADGIYEFQFSNKSAGVLDNYYCHSRHGGILSTGAAVRSNKPLQLVLQLTENHYGTYDSCFMYASVLPLNSWGNNFIVPIESTYLYVYAKAQTQVEIKSPGQPSLYRVVEARSNYKLADISSGTTIDADNPVYVLAVNCQPDQNFPWMYNVFPISFIGCDYFHDATYGEYDNSWPWPTNPLLRIMAVTDETEVSIDENNDDIPEYNYSLNKGEFINYNNPSQGAHIWANGKIYMVYIENWAQAFGGKYGGAAAEYFPTNSFGKSFALYDVCYPRYLPESDPRIFITAIHDNTSVNIDFNWDGIDVTNILNSGDVWPIYWPDDGTYGIGFTAKVWSDNDIQVIYRTDQSHNDHPGVNVAYTPFPLITIIEVDIDIKPGSDPNSINLKANGSVPVAIFSTDSFDATIVDPTTIMLADASVIIKKNGTPKAAFDDVNGDGLLDLIVHVNIKDLKLNATDTEAVLKGETFAGIQIRGVDTVRIIE